MTETLPTTTESLELFFRRLPKSVVVSLEAG